MSQAAAVPGATAKDMLSALKKPEVRSCLRRPCRRRRCWLLGAPRASAPALPPTHPPHTHPTHTPHTCTPHVRCCKGRPARRQRPQPTEPAAPLPLLAHTDGQGCMVPPSAARPEALCLAPGVTASPARPRRCPNLRRCAPATTSSPRPWPRRRPACRPGCLKAWPPWRSRRHAGRCSPRSSSSSSSSSSSRARRAAAAAARMARRRLRPGPPWGSRGRGARGRAATGSSRPAAPCCRLPRPWPPAAAASWSSGQAPSRSRPCPPPPPSPPSLPPPQRSRPPAAGACMSSCWRRAGSS
jgi:hypothetical protein